MFMGENMILLFFIQLSSVASLPSLPCTTMFVLSFSVYCVPSSNRPRRLSQITLPSFHILSQGTTNLPHIHIFLCLPLHHNNVDANVARSEVAGIRNTRGMTCSS